MKIYLATSFSNKENAPLKKNNNKYYLISYYYARCVKDISVHEWLFKEDILLDSGAFTFMNASKESQIDWDKYIEEYANFINKYNFDKFFELDIDSLVGIKEVERLRKKLENLTGKQCIPVWHKSRGSKYFKELCNNYKYISVGGLVTREIVGSEYPIIQKMVNYANSKGVKVHGLGFTKGDWLPKIKWYSVDSTSWKGTIMSYTSYIFNGLRIKGTPLLGFKTEMYNQLINKNIIAWVKYQKYADKHL